MTKKQIQKKKLLCDAAINKIKRLLWQKSWRAWKRLPPQVKTWIDPEDLYQEARMEAVVAFSKWTPDRGQFITFAYVAVDNRLSTYVGYWSAQKRRQGVSVELEVVDWEKFEVCTDMLVDAVIQFMAMSDLSLDEVYGA